MLQQQVISTFIGLLIGIGLVAWLSPDTNGTTFVVVVSVLACNAVGAVIKLLNPPKESALSDKGGEGEPR